MIARARTALSLLVLLLPSGCLPIISLESRTRILPDGTTIRETTYTKIRRDPNNDQERLWNSRSISEDLGKRLGEGFASIQREDDRIVLNGVFTRPDQVPADFLRDVGLVGSASRNRIEWKTEEILFGTRFLYRERFVDAIEPGDQKESRKKLVAFVVKTFRSAVRYEFGESWDLSELNRWSEEELAPLVDQLIGLYWQERKSLGKVDPLTGKNGFDRALRRAFKILARSGLRLDLEAEDDDNFARFQRWLQELLARHLKSKRDGQRAPTADDFRYLFPQEKPWTGVKLALERVAEREHGSVEKGEEAFQRVLLGVTGTYGSPPAEAEFRFDCTVEMPGILLRTNGFLESDQASFWLFEGEQIFPDGYQMEAESVVIDDRRLGRIRELQPRIDRRGAVRLIQRLEGVSAEDRGIMDGLLDDCARAGSLEALNRPEEKQTEKIRKKLVNVLEPILRETSR